MQRCVESRSIPLPSPPHYEGPQQVIPTMTQMFTETPATLGFNIEVKYPMPVSVEGKSDEWIYSPEVCEKVIKTEFETQ